MSNFTTARLSNKAGECRRIAGQIAEAANAMGLIVSIDKSGISASQYLYVSADVDGDQVKIRCSDHDDKHGGSDWQHWTDSCASVTIARLAERFGRDVPARFTAAAFAARSQAATSAAATRRADRRGTEAEMLEAVTAALRGEKTASNITAGRVIDRLYPTISRAQRQRLASNAVFTVKRDPRA